MEWKEIALKNKVKEVEKEIPLQINYNYLSCTAFTYGDNKIIKPIFRVRNCVPYCVIHIQLSNEVRGVHKAELVFKDDELSVLLLICEDVIEEAQSAKKKKNDTENLFH